MKTLATLLPTNMKRMKKTMKKIAVTAIVDTFV